MNTRLEQDAPKTTNFIKHILSELIKREPLRHGKVIILEIKENSPNFPEFTDNLYKGDQTLDHEYQLSQVHILSPDKMLKTEKLLRDTFKDTAEVKEHAMKNVYPVILDMAFIINDPDGLYKMAEDLGLSSEVKRISISENAKEGVKFDENIPELIFGTSKLRIKFGSMQFCLCKIAFSKNINEPISWDEIAEEIDGYKKKNLKSNWRRIYYVFWRLNKNFNQVADRDLFMWDNKTFRRLI